MRLCLRRSAGSRSHSRCAVVTHMSDAEGAARWRDVMNGPGPSADCVTSSAGDMPAGRRELAAALMKLRVVSRPDTSIVLAFLSQSDAAVTPLTKKCSLSQNGLNRAWERWCQRPAPEVDRGLTSRFYHNVFRNPEPFCCVSPTCWSSAGPDCRTCRQSPRPTCPRPARAPASAYRGRGTALPRSVKRHA